MTRPSSTRLAEVQRLTSALADQILDAQVMGRPVLGEQAVALAQAARLMQEHGMEWPPMLRQALHGLADGVDGDGSSDAPRPAEPSAKSVMDGLTRFMGAFRRDRE